MATSTPSRYLAAAGMLLRETLRLLTAGLAHSARTLRPGQAR